MSYSAQNGYLLLQSSEQAKYRAVLDSTGTVVIEYDWINGIFTYAPSTSIGIAVCPRDGSNFETLYRKMDTALYTVEDREKTAAIFMAYKNKWEAVMRCSPASCICTEKYSKGGLLVIVYFTGTGNSRYCAQFLAHEFGDELVDSFHFIRDGIGAELLSARPWVFVSPTYAWRMPRVFADFIRSGCFFGSREAYFVMTCGSGIGNAVAGNKALCAEKGLSYRGTLQVVMPENYIAMFNAPEKVQAQKIIEKARPAIERGATCIRDRHNFPVLRTGVIKRLQSGVVNSLFYRFAISAKAFTVSDVCTSCGKCAQLCVLNNIEMQGEKPVWGSRCTHCMACICACPAHAIEYGKASLGKPRYQCSDYEK